MKYTLKQIITLAVCSIFSSAFNAHSQSKILVTAQQKEQFIEKAQFWTDRGPELDIANGIREVAELKTLGTLDCIYDQEETATAKAESGVTPKFYCKTEKYGTVKVKYAPKNVLEKNKEIFAEVASSRLLWSLGYGADIDVVMTVRCQGCTEDPWSSIAKTDTGPARTFFPATVEIGFPGKKIKQEGITDNKKQGVSWKEIGLIDPGLTPDERKLVDAQRDGLRLVAALIQHGDNKTSQQKLMCTDKKGLRIENGQVVCDSTYVYIADVGATFGGAGNTTGSGAKMSFNNWKSKCFWHKSSKPSNLKVELNGSFTGTMDSPNVTEAGRQFLMSQLVRQKYVVLTADGKPTFNDETRMRTRLLFQEAHVELLHKQNKENITADDWAAAFENKVKQIFEPTTKCK